MKYNFFKVKGRNIRVESSETPEKTGNGLVDDVINSRVSSYDTTQIEFYQYILAKINGKKHIKRFEFSEGKIFIDTIDFKNDDFFEYNDVIELDSKLQKDILFCHSIRKLLEKYNEVREETISNIEHARNKIDKLKRKRINASDLLCDYSMTGMINANLDKESALEMCEYLVSNREEVLQGTYIKNRLFARVIDLLSCLIIILGLPFTGFLMLKIFNMGSILLGILSAIGCTSIMVGTISLAAKISNKGKNKIIDSLVAELEALYELSSDEKDLESSELKESVIDPFLEYIKRDAMYMSHYSEFDYGDIALQFKMLANDYVEAKKREICGGIPVDKYNFLNRLTALEVTMYSKNSHVGLKPNDLLRIKTDELVERLRYIGYDEKKTVEDRYLSFVFDQIKRVSEHPYEGCESELSKLFKLAQDYVNGTLTSMKNVSPYNLRLESPGSTLIREINPIELDITQKIDSALKTESLEEDLDIIEEVIKESLEGLNNGNMASPSSEPHGFSM